VLDLNESVVGELFKFSIRVTPTLPPGTSRQLRGDARQHEALDARARNLTRMRSVVAQDNRYVGQVPSLGEPKPEIVVLCTLLERWSTPADRIVRRGSNDRGGSRECILMDQRFSYPTTLCWVQDGQEWPQPLVGDDYVCTGSGDCGTSIHKCDLTLQSQRERDVVSIQPRQVLAAREARPAVASIHNASVLLAVETNAWIMRGQFLDDPSRGVRRPTVDHDNFECAERLVQQAVNGLVNEGF
jgi:hypothetical protein